MRHSAGGYLAATQMRAGRTLVVEGESDRVLMARVLEELKGVLPERVVVDSAEILVDSSRHGNRAAVEALHAIAVGNGIKLGALVDREFREFSILGITLTNNLVAHRTIDVTLFWTLGHSIENYFFDCDRYINYLRYRHAEDLPEHWEAAVRDAFESILRSAAGISLAAWEYSSIKRMGGLACLEWWTLDKGVPAFTPAVLEGQLVNRNFDAQQSQAAAARAKALIDGGGISLIDARLCSHGHIGEETIWSAIGAALIGAGASRDLGQAVATGFCEEKRRYAADSWAARFRDGTAGTPSELRDWLLAHPCPTP